MLDSLSIWHWALICGAIAVVWLPLPFAVYRMKRQLDRIIELLEKQRPQQ